MPELPEVEQARRYVHDNFLGMTITRVDAVRIPLSLSYQQDPDLKLFNDTTNEAFIAALTGKTVINTHRSGKMFWIELDTQPYPLFHFGMTGRKPGFMCKDADTQNLVWPPRFTKFILYFNDTYELAFLDPRRFAKMRLQHAPLTESPIKDLGFDPLHSMPSLDVFATLLSKRRGPIKSVLLDQSFCAGIGNWIADEILYHARIHPSQPTHSFILAEAEIIYEKIVYVIGTAVKCNEDKVGFPEWWMFHQRWQKGSGKKAVIVDEDSTSHAISFVTVGGRTSAVVALQKLRKTKIATESGDANEEVVKVEADLIDEADVKTKKVAVKTEKRVKTEKQVKVEIESANGERRTTRKRQKVDYTIKMMIE